MVPVNGLYGHIQRNALKSTLLLASFAGMLALYWWAMCLAYVAIRGMFVRVKAKSVSHGFEKLAYQAFDHALATWYVPVGIAVVWCTIAWIWHRKMISAATGARPIERRQEPKLYNMVENLAISAGLPMPRVEIMETAALNAYAAGLTPSTSTVAVTRGLLEALDPDELEAVLAHEITHIKNRDVRLMVVALIFVGALTFLGDYLRALFRGWDGSGAGYIAHAGARSGSSNSSWDVDLDDDDGETFGYGFIAVIVSVLVAIATLALTHVMALMANFAISRAREFMADAGAVELTKNPDAMISALRKISGDDEVPLASESLRAMMISRAFDPGDIVDSLFATHPPIPDRVSSLQRFAGGRITQRPKRKPRTLVAGGGIAPAGAIGFGGGARGGFGRRGLARG